MEKYSFVGLLLLAISAITAAFPLSKDSISGTASNGHIIGIMTDSTGFNSNIPDPTCRERIIGDGFPNCSFTNTLSGSIGSSTDILAGSHSVSIGNNTGSATTEAFKD